MKTREILTCLCLVACVIVAPTSLKAQPAADDLSTLEHDLERLSSLTTPVTRTTGGQGTAFVASAIADRSWSLTSSALRTSSGYKVPLDLQIAPFLLSSALITEDQTGHPVRSAFLQSTIEIQYAPLVFKHRSGGRSGYSTTPDQFGSISFSLPLLGTAPIQAFTDSIRSHLSTVLGRTPSTRPFTPKEVQDIIGAAIKARKETAAQYSRFSLQATAEYDWDRQTGTPDSYSAGLVASKVLTPMAVVLANSGPVWKLDLTTNETFYQSTPLLPSFSKISASPGISLNLPNDLTLSFVPTWDYYTDANTAKALGFVDAVRQNDITFKVAASYPVFKGKLAGSISELHLGTTEHTTAYNVSFNRKLPFPPDIQPGSANSTAPQP